LKKVIILHKKEGETPLEALEKFRRKNKAYKNLPMTYAGRLDPMASGLLLILTGYECKNKEKYLSLDKEYKFRVLFGFATDTYDVLGKVIKDKKDCNLTSNKIKKELESFVGEFFQAYPIYSSKTVKGKPLFKYAREDEYVKIPKQKIFVKKLKFEKLMKINSKNILQNIEKRINKMNGDFRQEEILKIWREKLQKSANKFFIADFKIKCGSGTYVRSIANSLGNKVGVPALAFSIERTKIGKWTKAG
jgi:tRNA pseudouridine55 synthase